MIIDGNKIAKRIREKIKEEIKKKQLKVNLAVIWIGDNDVSKVYIEKKKEAAQEMGIGFELFNFPKDISQTDLIKEMKEISTREDVNGIVVQLPLPSQIDTEEILKQVPEEKDVEGFVSSHLSPIVLAIEEILKEYEISLENKKIAIIGKGRLVGQPVAKWLKKKELEFKVIDKESNNMDELKEADLIISGVGVPNLVKENMVKEKVTIIDAGTCKIDGKTIGDVDFENVQEKAEYITPCVGGVGPVTVACLFKNLAHISID